MSVEQALLSFTLAAGLLTITPGLDTALVLRTSAVEGGKQAMLTGIGICFGCLLWGVAASFGLSALLAVSGFAYNVLRIVGASIWAIWESNCLFAHLRPLLQTAVPNQRNMPAKTALYGSIVAC
jgi:threonine/homoserine/homoserine lactone efflux protein